jgi:pimeloyl-ACP methyl ester carboxylesterase/class 3 adenylate cyclase
VGQEPVTRYAHRDGAYLAYQVVGDGPVDLVFIDTWVHHVEIWWESPDFARMLRRLAAIGRLVHYDRRGTGLSDPVRLGEFPGLDAQVADLVAVMDDAGVARATLIGFAEGASLAIHAATTVPERCAALVLVAPSARLLVDDDYPIGFPADEFDAITAFWAGAVRRSDPAVLDMMAPSRRDDPVFAETFFRLSRAGLAPGAVEEFYRQSGRIDVRAALPAVAVPTVVLHRADDAVTPLAHGRYVADHIPGARLVVLDGADHAPFTGDTDALIDEISEFVTGTRNTADPDRRLLALLFTDIVGSTATAAELGDREWRALLDEHDAVVRRTLARLGGTPVGHTGDGILASFATPSAALRGATALRAAVADLGLTVRTGVHTGEVEVRGADLSGMAVHIAARVCALAGSGEVWVTSTVLEALAGSGPGSQERGVHQLKGVPGAWSLFAVDV